MAERILLLVGTKKGAFIVESDADRRSWSVRGPTCEGYPIQDISRDPATGTLYAGGGSSWYGPTVFRSDDLGETWTQSSDGLTYGDDGPKISAVWNVTAAHGSVYAGVGVAGLFRSDDGGRTWQHVEGLTNHPSRPTWQPGRRRAHPPLDRPSPDRPEPGCGSRSRRSERSRPATAARPGSRATRRPGRLHAGPAARSPASASTSS